MLTNNPISRGIQTTEISKAPVPRTDLAQGATAMVTPRQTPNSPHPRTEVITLEEETTSSISSIDEEKAIAAIVADIHREAEELQNSRNVSDKPVNGLEHISSIFQGVHPMDLFPPDGEPPVHKSEFSQYLGKDGSEIHSKALAIAQQYHRDLAMMGKIEEAVFMHKYLVSIEKEWEKGEFAAAEKLLKCVGITEKAQKGELESHSDKTRGASDRVSRNLKRPGDWAEASTSGIPAKREKALSSPEPS